MCNLHKFKCFKGHPRTTFTGLLYYLLHMQMANGKWLCLYTAFIYEILLKMKITLQKYHLKRESGTMWQSVRGGRTSSLAKIYFFELTS